jgi:hypothetical protein
MPTPVCTALHVKALVILYLEPAAAWWLLTCLLAAVLLYVVHVVWEWLRSWISWVSLLLETRVVD